MTDTEAIALRANRARERHIEHRWRYAGKWQPSDCLHCHDMWPCQTAQLAADIPELLARVEALETAIGDALDLLGGMWSWSEANGYFLEQNGWVGMAGHVLRNAAGRPANGENLDAIAHAKVARAVLEGKP